MTLTRNCIGKVQATVAKDLCKTQTEPRLPRVPSRELRPLHVPGIVEIVVFFSGSLLGFLLIMKALVDSKVFARSNPYALFVMHRTMVRLLI